jgi:hypothetical protein
MARPLYPEQGVPVTLLIGGCMGLTANLDVEERRKILSLPGLELRPLGRPSLYKITNEVL